MSMEEKELEKRQKTALEAFYQEVLPWRYEPWMQKFGIGVMAFLAMGSGAYFCLEDGVRTVSVLYGYGTLAWYISFYMNIGLEKKGRRDKRLWKTLYYVPVSVKIMRSYWQKKMIRFSLFFYLVAQGTQLLILFADGNRITWENIGGLFVCLFFLPLVLMNLFLWLDSYFFHRFQE